jgi:hypothetical protein
LEYMPGRLLCMQGLRGVLCGWGIYRELCLRSVSIGTFVLVKQVNWVPGGICREIEACLRQHLYWCTSTASKLSRG